MLVWCSCVSRPLRSYDVYTPTRNIVYHDYDVQPNGHGENEWYKNRRDRFRKEAIARALTIAQLPNGDSSTTAQANLGIYGLGKRRTMKQLFKFVGMTSSEGNSGKAKDCAAIQWFPYDASISPVANLFDKPDDLDPQPEYPHRTKLIFYEQVEQASRADIGIQISDGAAEVKEVHRVVEPVVPSQSVEESSNLPPLTAVLVFWLFGLVVWCIMFMRGPSPELSGTRQSKKKKAPSHKD